MQKILNFVKKIHYYSKLFTSLLIEHRVREIETPHLVQVLGFPDQELELLGKVHVVTTVLVAGKDVLLQAIDGELVRHLLPLVEEVVFVLEDLGDLYAESGQTLQGSFSAVSKPNFASKYSFESSRRDLHNALLCTALESIVEKWGKKGLAKTTPKRKKTRK